MYRLKFKHEGRPVVVENGNLAQFLAQAVEAVGSLEVDNVTLTREGIDSEVAMFVGMFNCGMSGYSQVRVEYFFNKLNHDPAYATFIEREDHKRAVRMINQHGLNTNLVAGMAKRVLTYAIEIGLVSHEQAWTVIGNASKLD